MLRKAKFVLKSTQNTQIPRDHNV